MDEKPITNNRFSNLLIFDFVFESRQRTKKIFFRFFRYAVNVSSILLILRNGSIFPKFTQKIDHFELENNYRTFSPFFSPSLLSTLHC